MHIFSADTLEVVKTLSWPEYIDYGGAFEFGPGPSGDATDGVFALLRSDEHIYSDIEFYDLTTWERVGAIESRTNLGDLSFAEEDLLVSRPYERFAAGAVYLFSPPWQEDMETDDRVATHRHPDACDDCRFGQILQTLGDVTGDGLDDAVMGGGGFWFVDGDLLRVDQGVSSGVAVSAGAAGVERLITNVGDFDGDGIDDYATANLGAVALLRGGEPDPFARYHNPEDPELRIGNISDAIGPLGDIDGDGWPTIAAMAAEDSRLWLVEGPLRCGDYDIVDVGTLIESEADGYDSGSVPAGNGLLVTSSTDLATNEDSWRVMRWE